MFTIDADLPERLAPLAWLIGRWEGVGVVGYPTIESVNFGQEVECSHDGRGFLEWRSHTWLLDQETGEKVRPLATELGFWRPGEDGREVELLLTHPTGILEMYFGPIKPAKLELRTDSVVRSPRQGVQRRDADVRARRVPADVVMDMAAVGQPLQSHVSATLQRVG